MKAILALLTLAGISAAQAADYDCAVTLRLSKGGAIHNSGTVTVPVAARSPVKVLITAANKRIWLKIYPSVEAGVQGLQVWVTDPHETTIDMNKTDGIMAATPSLQPSIRFGAQLSGMFAGIKCDLN